MTISYFKKQSTHSMFGIPLLISLMWFPLFFQNPESEIYASPDLPLHQLLYNVFYSYSPVIGAAFSLVLILLQAFVLNKILIEHEVLNTVTYLPAYVYALLLCLGTNSIHMNEINFASVFIILALSELMKSYRKDFAFTEAFNSGFLISIGGLIYAPFFGLLLLCIIALLFIRPFIWREWIILLIGFALPILFAMFYYFWFDKWNEAERIYQNTVQLNIELNTVSLSHTIAMIAAGIALLFSLTKMFGGVTYGTVKSKNNLYIIYLIVPMMIFSSYVFGFKQENAISILAIPFSVLFANYLLSAKKETLANGLLWVVVFAIVVNRLIALNLFD